MLAVLGSRPTPTVAMPINSNVTTNVCVRPMRSPKWPKTAAPTGRARNAEANAPSEAVTAMTCPSSGKNTVGNTRAAAVP